MGHLARKQNLALPILGKPPVICICICYFVVVVVVVVVVSCGLRIGKCPVEEISKLFKCTVVKLL